MRLAGVNDGPAEAQQLSLLRGRPSLVNLIPYNPVRGTEVPQSASQAVARFVEIWNRGG